MRSPVGWLLANVGIATLTWSTTGCVEATAPTWGRVAEVRFHADFYDYTDTHSYSYNDRGQLVDVDGVELGSQISIEIVHGVDGPVELRRAGWEGFRGYSYENGRLVARTAEDGLLDEVARYTYEGDHLVEIERTATGANQISRVTRYSYDDEGRVVRDAAEASLSSRSHEMAFEYDDEGRLHRREVINGSSFRAFEYVYDEGRLVEVLRGDEDGPWQSAEIKYNGEGLLASVDYWRGRLDVTYDDEPVTALPVTLPLLVDLGDHEIAAPYFDHGGRSYSGVDTESLNFFLE